MLCVAVIRSRLHQVVVMASRELGKESPKIVIIGAGIAGLTAANRLHKAGFTNVTILEAQHRTGGRIFTQNYGPNGIIEIGAQFIHGQEGNPIYKLAKEHNLVIDDYDEEDWETYFYTQDGERVREKTFSDISKAMDNCSERADKVYRENSTLPIDENGCILSVGQFFKQAFEEYVKKKSVASNSRKYKILQGLFKHRMKYEVIDSANELENISLMSWGQYKECAGNNAVMLKYGYQKILELILKDVPNQCILLNKPVKKINWVIKRAENKFVQNDQEIQNSPGGGFIQSEQNVDNHQKTQEILNDVSHEESLNVSKQTSYPISIEAEDGENIEADHVIITCSLGYLKRNHETMFNPQLPDEKKNVIERLAFGTVDKIFLEFEKPFWNKSCDGFELIWLEDEPFKFHSDVQVFEQEWYRGLIGFYIVNEQPNVLGGWLSINHAEYMETLSEDVVLETCWEILKTFSRNSKIPKPINIVRTKWASNQYTCGAYSTIPVGATPEDNGILASPVPSKENPLLMFAGEATSSHYFSTVHGAYLTGEREAERLISLYNKETK